MNSTHFRQIIREEIEFYLKENNLKNIESEIQESLFDIGYPAFKNKIYSEGEDMFILICFSSTIESLDDFTEKYEEERMYNYKLPIIINGEKKDNNEWLFKIEPI